MVSIIARCIVVILRERRVQQKPEPMNMHHRFRLHGVTGRSMVVMNVLVVVMSGMVVVGLVKRLSVVVSLLTIRMRVPISGRYDTAQKQ